MPQETQTTQEYGTQRGTQTQAGTSISQLQAGPETALETVMRQIAGSLYQQYAGEAMSPDSYGGVTAQSVMAGGVSDAQRRMVGDWQASTLAASRAGLAGQMDEAMGTISNQMADRGLLDSSAYGAAAGTAARDLDRQYATMAAQAQAQAQQQLIGISGQNQSIGLNMMQMRDQARQWAANPQLLRDLMNYRLQTGAQVGSTQQNANSLTNSESYSTTVAKKPLDWASIIGNVASLGTQFLLHKPTQAGT
jgi:hypothetical protein